MKTIAMLLSNPFRPDPRVLKEANFLADSGYSVTIIAWDRQNQYSADEILKSGVCIHRVQNVRSAYGIGASQMTRVPMFWYECFKSLRKLKPSIVYCHDFDTLPAGLIWAKINNLTLIYDAHEYYADLIKPRLHNWWGKLLYSVVSFSERVGARLASGVVTVDETLAANYRQLNKNVVILGHYPPIDFSAQPAQVFSHPQVCLAYAGRISSDRGLTIYIKILEELLNRQIPVRLLLAGTFTPAAEETVLTNLPAEVRQHIEFQGWVDFNNMPAFLSQADIGLAILLPEPRYLAALPVKLFEYMACGLPVIASDFPSIRAVVLKAGCGILVDPLSLPAQIADKITVWWKNQEAARQAGLAGRLAFLQEYNFEQHSKPLLDLLNHLGGQ